MGVGIIGTIRVVAVTDRVLVHDLAIDCIVGERPHEREIPQRVRLDLELAVDCAPAAASDRLADAVDYVAVAALASRVCVEGRFHLVETLADRVAWAVLDAFPAHAVTVRVRKPAGVLAAAWVGCECTRERR